MFFAEHDYRKLLRESLLARKARFGRRYTFEKMAQSCRVQKAYLSKVLTGNGHLSEDQAYLICEYLGFTTLERDFILLLLALDRCSVISRQRELKAKLQNIKDLAMQTDSHIDAEPLTDERSTELSSYYLSPLMQVVHMFLTIPKYAKNIDAIQNCLKISKEQLESLIKALERMQIVSFTDRGYKVIRDNLHLSPNSELFATYRTLHRLHAMEQIPRCDKNETYNFSAIISSSEKARNFIQEGFLELLKGAEKMVRNEPNEGVFQINFDLFNWSSSNIR